MYMLMSVHMFHVHVVYEKTENGLFSGHLLFQVHPSLPFVVWPLLVHIGRTELFTYTGGIYIYCLIVIKVEYIKDPEIVISSIRTYLILMNFSNWTGCT